MLFQTAERRERMKMSKTMSDNIVARRVDLPCSMTGFSPPPCNAQLKFEPEGSRWTMIVLCPPGKPPQVARWLEAYKPASIHIGTGLSPRILRATFDELPGRWGQMLASVQVQFAQLTPDGSASIFVEDVGSKVELFVQSLQLGRPEVRARKKQPDPNRVKLTPRQLEVLSLAVALGYYEVPHKLNLRELAQKLSLSVGAVSELLRRAEALVITSYIDSLSESLWESDAVADGLQEMEPVLINE
jgi:DNA-binding CsgD family transcriptional regulator